jgi:hypothetical protein
MPVNYESEFASQFQGSLTALLIDRKLIDQRVVTPLTGVQAG